MLLRIGKMNFRLKTNESNKRLYNRNFGTLRKMWLANFEYYLDICYRSCVLAFLPPAELNVVYPSEPFCCAQENLRFWPSKQKNPSEPLF